MALLLSLLLGVIACGGSDLSLEPAQKSGNGNKGAGAETAEFPDKDLIVTATCSATDRGAEVTVTGWDVRAWEAAALRTFDVPADVAVDRKDTDARSPLIELCGDAFPGLGGANEGPREVPEDSLRQLFDKDYMRMAVLLLDAETGGTRAGYLDAKGKITELSRHDRDAFTDAPGEQNAVFSEDGGAVWFTQDIDEAKVRIVSRSVSGEHALREHGGGDGMHSHDALTVASNPTRGVFGAGLQVSPDGQRAITPISGFGWNIVNLPRESTVINTDSDLIPVPYDSECDPRGWIDDVTVLCSHGRAPYDAARTNSFSRLDTSLLDRHESIENGLLSEPIIPSTDRENTVRAISPDGEQMIFASLQGSHYTYFRSSTAPGSSPERISAAGALDALSSGDVLEWR
ncbi:hypothetical protein ACXZ65_13745 [Streptomyces aculeolatus]